MKTFNKVKNLIQHGHWVACETVNRNWKVFMLVNDEEELEGTGIKNTIEKSIKYGLYDCPHNQEDFENEFTDNYKVVTPAPKLLKPGDKVEILENVREHPDFERWLDPAKEMVGQKGLEIRRIDVGDYCVYTKDKSDHYSFPYWAVVPYYEDEEEETLSGKEVTVTIDGVEHVAVIK